MSRIDEATLLALHRDLVATPSVSGSEQAIADRLAAWLGSHGLAPTRLGDSLLALAPTAGGGPLLLFDTHVDTVPPGPGWSVEPFAATRRDGRVIGLGAGDAKASVAAMTAAFCALVATPPPGITVGLALVAGEETRSQGTRDVLDHLAAAGTPVAAAVFGEPTGLDLAVAQKGLLVLELTARGQAAHAAHARALGGDNAIAMLARDLMALQATDLGPAHPRLGSTTLEPTVLRAGEARNVVPGVAMAILDARTVPSLPPAELVARLRHAVAGELEVLSDRLAPQQTPDHSALLAAAELARPQARRFGSPTLSDWALLDPGLPAVKVGPGRSERSHTVDEWVDEEEIVEAARFYEALARRYAQRLDGARRRPEEAA